MSVITDTFLSFKNNTNIILPACNYVPPENLKLPEGASFVFCTQIHRMKSATVSELKTELQQLDKTRLIALCQRLARFKKENKELLTYLLFEAQDLDGYLASVKQELDAEFESMNTASLYFMKKTLRKILRIAAKHIRYCGEPVAEVELLLHFCTRMKELQIPFAKAPVLANLYNNQVKKLQIAVTGLHEDLQYEYRRQAEGL
jgi:hypothetical protein